MDKLVAGLNVFDNARVTGSDTVMDEENNDNEENIVIQVVKFYKVFDKEFENEEDANDYVSYLKLKQRFEKFYN